MPSSAKSDRVLACVLCSKRKIKCDRQVPCSNCVKASETCVPASLAPRQRRRRFPERDLLDRLRRYEGMLKQNNIKFEPLHPNASDNEYPAPDDGQSEEDPEEREHVSGQNGRSNPDTPYEAKNIYHAMRQGSQEPEVSEDDDKYTDDAGDMTHDQARMAAIKKAYDEMYERNDHLLFSSRIANIDLCTLHPGQAQIFRLWQIYLDNVNPLLKVTHTPTLQQVIIDAASDVSTISPQIHALMFSIYCVALMSMVEGECQSLFGSPREDLLRTYQLGCQVALQDCQFLRTADRDCLTAMYLYLVSLRPNTDPLSLSSMLGLAVRIAQRMQIHNEAANVKCGALEAEMRRRLWWSLIIFDNRVSEMVDYKVASLTPTWDCRIPLNVNDFELRPEMKLAPVVYEQPTEALFAVARSEMSDFVRRSAFHLDFSNPLLRNVVKGPILEGDDVAALETRIEGRFKFCNPENPLHFMTIWSSRMYLGKIKLLEHCSRHPRPSAESDDTQRNIAFSTALRTLECDTQIMGSPLTKGFLWHSHFYFPMPAWKYIVQDLIRRPIQNDDDRTWEIMSDNHEARFPTYEDGDQGHNPLFKIFSKLVLSAWNAREAALREKGQPVDLPRIISAIKNRMMLMGSSPSGSCVEQPNGALKVGVQDTSMPMSLNVSDPNAWFGMEGQGFVGPWVNGYLNAPGQTAMNFDVTQLDWTTMDWNMMGW